MIILSRKIFVCLTMLSSSVLAAEDDIFKDFSRTLPSSVQFIEREDGARLSIGQYTIDFSAQHQDYNGASTLTVYSNNNIVHSSTVPQNFADLKPEDVILRHLENASIDPTIFPLPTLYNFFQNSIGVSNEDKLIVRNVLAKKYIPTLSNILSYHISKNAPRFISLTSNEREELLIEAASLVIQGKANPDTDALSKALGRKHISTLSNVLYYHISKNAPRFISLTSNEREELLIEAASLVIQGKANLDTDALNKALGKKHVPTLSNILSYHISKNVSHFTALKANEREDLLMEAASLVAQGRASLNTDVLNKVLGKKYISILNNILSYHINRKTPQFIALTVAQKEDLLMEAGSLIIQHKATPDTDALNKALAIINK